MKKWLIALLAALLMLGASSALAVEAADITDQCKFQTTSSKYKYTQMTDKKYTSYWKANKAKNPSIAVTAPKDQLIGGIYACFGNLPEKSGKPLCRARHTCMPGCPCLSPAAMCVCASPPVSSTSCT